MEANSGDGPEKQRAELAGDQQKTRSSKDPPKAGDLCATRQALTWNPQ